MTVPNTTYRVLVEKLGDSDPSQFVGNEGEVFYDPNNPALKLSDGTTAGGVSIGGTGGSNTISGIDTTGTSYFNDIQVSGVSVLGNTIVGGGTTQLLVNGDARIVGILTIGTSSITLDGSTNTVSVGSGITFDGSTGAINASSLSVDGVSIGGTFGNNLATVTILSKSPGNTPVGSGEVVTITLGTINNTNLTPGVYSGVIITFDAVTLRERTFTATYTVAGNGDITAEVTATDPGFFVNDTGTLLGSDIGGSSPTDDITVTIASITNIAEEVELDLTKSVNKLTNGDYTLADGVEGQIMYLVPQTGADRDNIYVTISNIRVLTDNVNPSEVREDEYIEPFKDSTSANLINIVTLIFTDGAWNISGAEI
jgi:hypothetical protein